MKELQTSCVGGEMRNRICNTIIHYKTKPRICVGFESDPKEKSKRVPDVLHLQSENEVRLGSNRFRIAYGDMERVFEPLSNIPLCS